MFTLFISLLSLFLVFSYLIFCSSGVMLFMFSTLHEKNFSNESLSCEIQFYMRIAHLKLSC